MTTRTALYRHYDATDACLYIGITDDLSGRDKAHASGAVWHKHVVRTETEWFNSRIEARAAETRAILQERPAHNRMSAIKDLSSYGAIGMRLVELRASEGLTQTEFANLIGVKRSRYSLWECGAQRLSLNGALALHKVMAVSLDWLFLGDDEARQ